MLHKIQLIEILPSQASYIPAHKLLIVVSRCDDYEDCFDKSDEVGCDALVDSQGQNKSITNDWDDIDDGFGEDAAYYEEDYSSYLDYNINDTAIIDDM